jgi:hypothetical protein
MMPRKRKPLTIDMSRHRTFQCRRCDCGSAKLKTERTEYRDPDTGDVTLRVRCQACGGVWMHTLV